MSDERDGDDKSVAERRRLLKQAMAGGIVGMALVPERWARPVIDSVIVPAHAQTSPVQTSTTTTSPTTTGTTTSPTATSISDARLKHGIERVGQLENGLVLYRYRYLWSDVDYVGVMAQEVMEVLPDAVVRGSDGYLRVRYERLGARLMTWEQWLASPREPARPVH